MKKKIMKVEERSKYAWPSRCLNYSNREHISSGKVTGMRLIYRTNGAILKLAVVEFTKKSSVLHLFLSISNAGHPWVNLFIIIITHVNTSFKRK